MKRYEVSPEREQDEIFFGDATREQVARYERVFSRLTRRYPIMDTRFSELVEKFREKYRLLDPLRKNVKKRSTAAERQARYKERKKQRAKEHNQTLNP